MIYVRTPVAPLIPSVDFPPPRARALVLASSTPPRDATAIPAPTAHAISATLARHPRDVDVLARDRSLTSVSPRSSSRMLATPSANGVVAREQIRAASLRASKFERSPREMLCASLSLILASRGRAQCRLRTRVGLCRSVGFVGDGATATARLHLLLLGRLACTARKRFPDSHGAMWGDDGHVLILWHRSIRGVYCGIVVATGQRDARGGAVFSLD